MFVSMTELCTSILVFFVRTHQFGTDSKEWLCTNVLFAYAASWLKAISTQHCIINQIYTSLKLNFMQMFGIMRRSQMFVQWLLVF